MRLYDGVYHGELMFCIPGSFEGIDWNSEEVKATMTCVQDGAAWMTERC